MMKYKQQIKEYKEEIEKKYVRIEAENRTVKACQNILSESILSKQSHRTSYFEFLYEQTKFIKKRWWILQGCILMCLWIWLSNYTSDISVYDLAKFDEQDFVDEYLSECYAEAYDEKLDYYVDKAMSAASNAFAELAEEAKDEADMLLRQIEELETLAKKVLKLFKSLPLNDIRIDNTKK